MKSIERYFYLVLVTALGILLLYNWKCQKLCPEPGIVIKHDTIPGEPVIANRPLPVSEKNKNVKRILPYNKTPVDPSEYFPDTSYQLPFGTVVEFDTTLLDYYTERKYDTTYKFEYGEIRLVDSISENKLQRQTVIPKWYTTTTENTYEVPVIKKREWSVGIQGGYGFDQHLNRTWYVGIGLQRNLFSFSLKKRK